MHQKKKEKKRRQPPPFFFSMYSAHIRTSFLSGIPPMTMRELRPNQRPLNDRPGIIGIIWPVVYSS